MLRKVLCEQTIVITDALECARQIEIERADDGFPTLVLSAFMFGCAGPLAVPEYERLRVDVRALAIEHLLVHSGIGRIDDLVRSSAGQWQALGQMQGAVSLTHAWHSAHVYRAVTKAVGGSIKKAVGLASQTTVLAGRELDTTEDFDPVRATDPDLLRFPHGEHPYAPRQRLARIANEQVVFDQGEESTTDVVKCIRTYAADCVLGVQLDLTDADTKTCGFVLTANDAVHPDLQVADVAAGWASWIAREEGLLSVVRRFSLVLYNGRRLEEDRAAALDRDRRRHAAMLEAVSVSGA